MVFEYTYTLLSSIVLGIIATFGFAFNLIVLLIIIIDWKNLCKPINIIIINLTIQNILIAVFGCPVALIAAVTHGYSWDQLTCQWYACIMTTLGIGIIGNLTVLAVERWFLLKKISRALTVRRALFLTGVVWVYALSMSLPPVFGWGKYGTESANISCSVSWENHLTSMNNRSFIIYLFSLGLFLPTIIITSCYISIIRCIKKSTKRVGSGRRRDLKVLRMVIIMTFTFLLAWAPYAVLALIMQFSDYRAPPIISILPCLLAKSSVMYNPIIYAGSNQMFLNSLKNLYKKNNPDNA